MVAVALGVVITISLLVSNISFAKSFGAKLCETPRYSCYVVKKGDTWKKLFKQEEQRDFVMRVNRMNTNLYRGLIIAVPLSLTDDYLQYSPLPNQIDPPGKRLIIVTINDLAFGAYEATGELVHWGPISSGKGYCRDVRRHCGTPSGKFAIYDKRGPDCVSTKFPVRKGGAPMPYCMFFHGGYALHGSPVVPGYNASHGCVRLFVNDARWLNEYFDDGDTEVIVKR